ncbi:PREDICTED: protein ZGRF1 [Propithecus coquereli]|uniref:protein ZGRF1 n=1 Tax=Propithecus coquereli TaxID=379532 RepID=UPI00063F66C9|nr:PREDICTED: protein ZGRF1 [Propithecus coquereli]
MPGLENDLILEYKSSRSLSIGSQGSTPICEVKRFYPTAYRFSRHSYFRTDAVNSGACPKPPNAGRMAPPLAGNRNHRAAGRLCACAQRTRPSELMVEKDGPGGCAPAADVTGVGWLRRGGLPENAAGWGGAQLKKNAIGGLKTAVLAEAEVGGPSSGALSGAVAEAPELNSRRFISSGRSLGCQPAGLKRKFTGFQGPRQVPKKTVITENGESSTSLEAKKPSPTFFSPFYSTPPLFPTVGNKNTNTMSTDPENIVTYKNRERNGMPFSSVVSDPSFKINPAMLCEDNYFCSAISSGSNHSDSLLTSEPKKRDNLSSHCLGVSQNIRSKAQILALLKSKSASTCEKLNSEVTGHFPPIQPQETLKIATKPIQQEEWAEMKSTGNLHYQHPSENTMRNKSRWAVYLSSQSSPILSTADGNDMEGKPKAQKDDINLNLKELLVQKRTQFFETCTEKGKKCNVDKPVDNNDPSWNQEVKLELPSFCESDSLQVSSPENDGVLSESDIQENTKIRFNQMDTKGSILIRENVQEANTRGTSEKECKQLVSSLLETEHLQNESSLSSNPRISDDITDMFSKSNTDNESLNSIHESLSNVTEPFLQVTFNLNNFETSDTEEESQENSRISQNSDSLIKEILVNDGNSCVQKRCENISCQEIGSEHLPLLASVGGKPTETFPVKETLPLPFCDKTCVGFDTQPIKAGNTGREIEEYSDILSNFDSSLECTDDVYIDNKEDSNKSMQKVRINYDFALLPNESKDTSTNLHIPHFLNIATDQTPENNSPFSEDAQSQPTIVGSDLDKNDEQILPSTSSSDNSIQLLNSNQNDSECITLDKSNMQISSSLFYPLGKKHVTSTEALILESEDLGGIRSLSHDHIEVETARESKQCWNDPRNSSELSGLVNNIALLKSLSEHRTALDSLEILKKENTIFQQQGTQPIHEPESSSEARKPFTTEVSQAIPKSSHPNQDSQQFFSLGSEEETAFLAVTSKQIERKTCDPKPVEFQGHQVKGSATSGVMIRGHSAQLGGSHFPDSTECGNFMTDACFLTPKLPSTCTQTDFLQSTSPEQKISTLSPVSMFSLNSRDEDFMLEFSEKSLKARTLPGDLHFLNLEGTKKSSSLENENLQRLSLVSRSQVPLTTLPPTHGPPDLDSCAHVFNCNTQESSASPMFNSCEESAVPLFSFGPEDQSETSFSKESTAVTRGDVSLLDNISTQSKWLKYQNTSQCNLTAPNRVDTNVTDGFFAEAGSAMRFSNTGERQRGAICESSLDSVRLQMIRGMLYQPQQDFCSQDLVSKKKALSLNLKQSFKNEEIQNVLGGSACCTYSTKDLQEINCSELCFPSGQKVKSAYLPQRQIYIPAVFQSPAHYKQTFTSCLIEHLNIMLFGLAQRLHKALSKVDMSFYTSLKGEKLKNVENNVPSCHHNQPAKLVMVKKEGPNKLGKTIVFSDDLWVVSKTLDFELDTFIARSAFFGPSSLNEVELLPLKGYFPSNWPINMVVHALLVCNASTELTTLKNIQDYFNPATLPLTQYLLTMSSPSAFSNKRVSQRKFIPPAFTNISTKFELLSLGATLQLAGELIQEHKLNKDQATALIQIAQMMASQESAEEVKELQIHTLPITIIHGVFGAGKSYLLAVVILFFVRLFEKSAVPMAGNARPWKLLISSSTNVAVDRVLLGLLSLGFEKFVRVGSIRKIAKPILPYSLHAGSENENEQLKELHALMREDLTPVERVYVRKSIEQHKLGTNRTLLKQVRVVGVTCAACPFPCMNDLKFPVVVLDECSQITEPASLLPIARFECEKLILVGDPKQLPPTIQGSDAAHENGLEQTLFDRLCLMGHKPILLRTQYRCHPAISAIANNLFYDGSLLNGVSETERSPLLEWLPTLCFYNVKGLEQIERDNSFHNMAEAAFTLKLIQSLIASGIAGSMIGVITLYKSQMYKLCHLLSAVDLDHPNMKTVQVSTVDAFQGAEKEIIILSCVRTRQVGFIDSEKRMNVALTRGKRHLLIVGNLACLRRNRLWGRVIQHCEGREDGLQHASQCEPQLNHLLKDYFEKQAEEKQKKKNEKEKI